MHQAQSDYESLKKEHARLLSLASDTVGTADGTLARLKKVNIAIHEALDRYHEALVLYRDSGNAFMEADTLDHLGRAYAAFGEHDQAFDAWARALELYRAQGRIARADDVTSLMASKTPADQVF